IDLPASDSTITVGQSVTFNGSATDTNPNATINYHWVFDSASGVANSTQQTPGSVQFKTSGVFTVTFTVQDSLGFADPHPPTRVITVLPSSAINIARSGWTLESVDSEELNAVDCCPPSPATNAFDGNPNTFWHTEWVNAQPVHPHDIKINLGAVYSMIGFRHLPRQDGMPNGRIGQYKFYVSSDGQNWGPPVASGVLPDTAAET